MVRAPASSTSRPSAGKAALQRALAAVRAQQLDVARDQLVKAEAVFGQHHLSLLCLSRSLDELDRVV
ncbi:MAG: hypothetical protein M3680_27090, partial [Myxococcota bacterium]|nr:hypothetical protein [Myxococcota bacterium]